MVLGLFGILSLVWLHAVSHSIKHYANCQNLDLHVMTSSHAKIDYCCLTNEPTLLYLSIHKIICLAFVASKVVLMVY
jgi:hypothetical protein